MKKKILKNKIKKVIREFLQQIKEASTTAGVPGYATPFAFMEPGKFKKTKHSYSAYVKEVPKTNIFFKRQK